MRVKFAMCLAFAGAACGSPDAWTTHNDRAGYSVQHPPGWAVVTNKTGRVEMTGPGGLRAAIWPVFVPRPLEARSGRMVLEKLASSACGNTRWDAPDQPAPGVVRRCGTQGQNAVVAVLSWIGVPKGTAATLYVTSGPGAMYRQNEEVFARIFASFRVVGAPLQAAPKGGALPSLPYSRATELREHAFSFEAPNGWRTNSMVARLGMSDTRSIWETVSPDGVRVAGGDAEIPQFTEPSQITATRGLQEGAWDNAYGRRAMVRRYTPGVVFSREYAALKAQGCTDLRITENRDRPDFVAALNALSAQFRQYGVAQGLTAGETAFTCVCGGKAVGGYWLAGVQRTRISGMPGGNWSVVYLLGYMAPSGKEQLAHAVLSHVLRTYEINPQWYARELRASAQVSEIIRRTNDEISNQIMDSYWNRQRVMDELDRRRSNAIRSVEDVIDPQFGQQFQVETGSNYYWIDHRGTIVGTETQYPPGLAFREMVRLP